MSLEKTFDAERLYNHIVHYYIDKKGVSKADANKIAQSIITRELERYICKDGRCGHLSYDHIKIRIHVLSLIVSVENLLNRQLTQFNSE